MVYELLPDSRRARQIARALTRPPVEADAWLFDQAIARGLLLRSVQLKISSSLQMMMNGRPTIKTTFYFRRGEAPDNYGQVGNEAFSVRMHASLHGTEAIIVQDAMTI